MHLIIAPGRPFQVAKFKILEDSSLDADRIISLRSIEGSPYYL